MNVKSFAVWLGLATAAAPVLPSDLTPLAPNSAEAALVQQAADAQGSQDQLNRMAKELAFTDARLSAVLAKLRDSFGVKSPETEDGAPAAGLPMGVDAYTAALIAFSAETGRTLAFTLPAGNARSAQKSGEEERFARAGAEADVKARRDELQAQQMLLWAQLAWGTFTGRDDDGLYINRTKVAPDANENARQQQRVLDAGVKLRRVAAHTMNQASIAASAKPAAADSAGPDLPTLTASVAEPVAEAVKELLTAITEARIKGKFSEAELKSMQDLRGIAEALRGAATNAVTAATNIASAEDEVARSSHRADLQNDLKTTSEQAARLDQALLAAQKAWNVELDLAMKLGPVVPRATRPQPQGPTPARKPVGGKQDITETFRTRFGIGSEFEVRESHGGDQGLARAKVVANDGRIARLTWDNKVAKWEVEISLDGDFIKVASVTQTEVGKIFKNWIEITNIRMAAPSKNLLREEDLKLEGSWDWRDPKANAGEAAQKISFEFRPSGDNVKASLKRILPVGSKFNGRWKNGQAWERYDSIEVLSNDGEVAKLRWRNEWAVWEIRVALAGKWLEMTELVQNGPVFPKGQPCSVNGRFSNIRVSAPADKVAEQGTIRFKGMYDWSNVCGSATDWTVEIELNR